MAFLTRFRRNRNRDSCEKNATGTENTGIRRIPAGIGNLVHRMVIATEMLTGRLPCISSIDFAITAILVTNTSPCEDVVTRSYVLGLHESRISQQ
jgi:hypothetical protein